MCNRDELKNLTGSASFDKTFVDEAGFHMCNKTKLKELIMPLENKQAYAQPTEEEVLALDGRIYAMLSERELQVLKFYFSQGRKFGVSVTIENKADPKLLESARSEAEAHAIMKMANSIVSVKVSDLASRIENLMYEDL